MSLSDCVERTIDEKAAEVADGAEQLRDALFSRLGTERIATLAMEDVARARREVAAALEIELSTADFAHLDRLSREELAKAVADETLGLGPIEPLICDPSVTEIMVNGPFEIYIERDGRLEKTRARFTDETQLRSVIDRIVSPVGRRVDEQTPMVSAHLPSGHRANVVVKPIAADGPVLTIRKFRQQAFTLDELVETGSLTRDMASLLAWAVKSRKNIAVCGGTGGGKTTLLNALSAQIGPDERIITIEDSLELRFDPSLHVVRLEARGKNIEGAGEVTIRDLMTNALRMRPDRIIIGECRGAEALDMLQAMNTGHDGSMTSLHANSPDEVVTRLVMMARYGVDLPVAVIEEQIASALDLVVQQDRFPDGSRKVTAIVEVERINRRPRLKPIVRYSRRDAAFELCGRPSFFDELGFLGIATEREVGQWGDSLQSAS